MNERFKTWRTEILKISKCEMARKMKVRWALIHRWELGKSKPELIHFGIMTKVFQISADDLLPVFFTAEHFNDFTNKQFGRWDIQ